MRLTMLACALAVCAVLFGCQHSGSQSLVGATSGGDVAGGDAVSSDGDSIFLNIVPPGSNGNSAGGVGVQQVGALTLPDNWQDQSKLYGDLAYAKTPLKAKPCNPPVNIAAHKVRSDLACNYFKHEGLSPDKVVSTTSVTAPSGHAVTIKRDDWGVPFIEGPSRQDAMYGVGYAAAHDRLWLFDILRHLGRGHLSEFLGPSPTAYQFDAQIGSYAGYSEAELTMMIDRLGKEFGPLGQVVLADLNSFVAGMNAYVQTLVGKNLAQLPLEYATLGLPDATLQPPIIKPFTAEDIVGSAILIQSLFATGGGDEAQAELLLQHLDPGFGPSSTKVPMKACKFWRDVRHADDPDATRTIDVKFHTQTPPAIGDTCPRPLRSGVAIWDPGSYEGLPVFTATDLTQALKSPAGINDALGGLLNTLSDTLDLSGLFAPQQAMRKPTGQQGSDKQVYRAAADPKKAMRVALAKMGIRLPSAMSNWIGVTGEHTKSGHPIAVMGPQTAYFEPELLWEFAVKSDGGTPLDFNGRGIATANLPYIVIGRGTDFAWSATSGNSDLVDTRVSKLCNKDDTPPSRDDLNGDGFPDADGYQFYLPDGTKICAPFIKRKDRWAAIPTTAGLVLGGSPLPQIATRHVLRTHYGPVIATATVNGDPVVVSQQRSTFFDEMGTVAPFALAATHVIQDATDFKQVFNGVTGTFNWLYVDKNDLGYIHSGLYPVRNPEQDLDLPVWGNGKYEWQSQTHLSADFFADRSASNPYPNPATPQALDAGVVQVDGKEIPTTFQWPDYMAYADHPQAVNPERGYLMSWNNLPARGWRAADFNGSFGPIHRVDLLGRRLQAYLATGKKEDIGTMVETMADAAYADLRGEELLPLMLDIMQTGGTLTDDHQQVIDMMQDWIDADSSNSWIGSHASFGSYRRDRDNDGVYDHHAAVAVMDAWYKHMETTVTPRLDKVASAGFSVGQGRFNAPGPKGSAFQEGWYEQMTRLFRMALGKADHPYQTLKCAGSGSLTDCRQAVLSALDAALGDLGGLANKDNWASGLEAGEAIAPSNFSLLPTASFPWTNRPTFQQVIEVH